jgi:hypothetical protein
MCRAEQRGAGPRAQSADGDTAIEEDAMADVQLLWPGNRVMDDQANTTWCWAAVLQSIIRYYKGQAFGDNFHEAGMVPQQADLVAKVGVFGLLSPNEAVKRFADVLDRYGYYANLYGGDESGFHVLPTASIFSVIKAEIAAGRPLAVGFRLNASSWRHAGVIYGYNDTTATDPQLYVIDPRGRTPTQAPNNRYALGTACLSYRGQMHIQGIILTQPLANDGFAPLFG